MPSDISYWYFLNIQKSLSTSIRAHKTHSLNHLYPLPAIKPTTTTTTTRRKRSRRRNKRKWKKSSSNSSRVSDGSGKKGKEMERLWIIFTLPYLTISIRHWAYPEEIWQSKFRTLKKLISTLPWSKDTRIEEWTLATYNFKELSKSMKKAKRKVNSLTKMK